MPASSRAKAAIVQGDEAIPVQTPWTTVSTTPGVFAGDGVADTDAA